MAQINILAKLPKDFFELLGSSKWKDRKEALEKLLSELDIVGPCTRLDQSANYGELMGELKQIIWKDSNVVVVTLAVRVLSGIARGFASKFTKYVPMFMTIVFEKFKDKKTSVREALNECVDTVASTSHADCFVASLTEVFEKKSVNPDIKANIDRWIYRTLLHYTQTNPPNDFITNMAPFIAQHICDGDADVRDAACMACAGVMRLIGEKTTSALIKGWVDDKVKQKKVNEYHEKAVAEAEELAKSAGAQSDDQHDDQNNLSGDKEKENGVSNAPTTLAIDPWELLEEVGILEKLPKDFSEMVTSKQWKDRLKALEDLNGILTKSERLSSKEDYGEIVVTLAKVLAKDVNVNVAAMSTKCLKGLANGIRFKFSPFASLVMKSALQKFKEKKTVLREPLIELVDSIAVITPLSSYVDEVSAAMAQVNPQIKSQTALFMARLLKQHSAKTFPDQFSSLAPQINKLTTDPDTEVRDASYCLLGAAMKSLTERQLNALFSDIVNDNIRMAKANCSFNFAFVKEQHAKVVEECGDAASDAILKLLKATDSSETTAAPKNVSKTTECGKDSARKPATAIGHNKRPQQNTRAQDQHLARMMAARKGGGTPKTNISSSVSTPHLSAHPRRASSSINRAVSPLTNGNATQTPQQYNFASGPRKMPSAGDIRHNVASAPQSARSHHVVMASQARGVEEHIARLAQRRAAEQSKAQNKDYRSRVRNPSAGRSVPQNATTSGYSSARGAGPVRLLTKNAPLSTTNASLSNRPITAPVSRYNPSNDIHESDQNANKLPHRPNLSSHCSVSSHPVKSYHGSRLPLPSSARQ